jgi:hypothetical protein
MDKLRRGGLVAALLGAVAGAGALPPAPPEKPKDPPKVVNELRAKADEKRKRRQERNLRLSGQK